MALGWAVGSLYWATAIVVGVGMALRSTDDGREWVDVVSIAFLAMLWPLWLPVWAVRVTRHQSAGRHAAPVRAPAEPTHDLEVRPCP